jgi:hypothetical protein
LAAGLIAPHRRFTLFCHAQAAYARLLAEDRVWP